jgi:hypothetical protein
MLYQSISALARDHFGLDTPLDYCKSKKGVSLLVRRRHIFCRTDTLGLVYGNDT